MALKDCKFYVDIDGKQVEMDFDGFRAHLMREGVMATLAPDLTKKRGKSAGFTLTARAEAAPARAEAPKAKAEAPAPSEMELTAENLRKLMPKLGKSRAEAIVALMKAMGIPFERIKLAKGVLKNEVTLQQAQEKKKPKLVTAITGMTPQQAIEYFKKAKLIRPELAREILSKDVPEHLKPVAEFIFRQRQKFLDGKMTVRDVAKAYIITVSSIQAGAIGVDTIKASTGQTFPEYATMRGKKGDIQIRPEDAVSAWLLTPDGKKALDSLEQTGKVDEKLWQPLIDLRQAYGNNTLKTWAFSPESKGVNLHKIEEMTQLINQTGGNPRKLEAAVQRLVGIKDAKAGFIKHLLGFGDTPTVDAREINFWLTGQADISSLKTKGAEVARAAKDASGKVRQFVVKRIGNQIKDLAKQYDMDVNVGAHIVHHWLWDATSNEVTTHAVMMDAMELAQAEKASAPLGSIEFLDDLNALISVFEKANFSTVLHEGMHFYRRHMLNVENGFTAKQIKEFEDWAGAKNGVWSVAAEEKAARAFEKYLRDGKAPTAELAPLFKKVAAWMRQVYETLTGSAIDIDIPPNIREVFDRIFTLEAERQGKILATGKQSDGQARDAEYMAAVKAGDTAKAQRMVDEAAKAAGYTSELVQHTSMSGIPGRFTVFKYGAMPGGLERFKTNWAPNRLIAALEGLSPGWFTTNPNQFEDFRGDDDINLYKAYLQFNNPLVINADEKAQTEFLSSKRELVEKSAQLEQLRAAKGGSGLYTSRGAKLREEVEALEKQVRLESRANVQGADPFDRLRALGKAAQKDNPELLEGAALRESLLKQGYDGIILQNTNADTSRTDLTLANWYIPLLGENQIKSADPITRDDKGNVIPLSQRFQPSTPDIRYQEADFTPAPDVREAAKRWAGVREITPALNSTASKFHGEYNEITARMMSALRSKSVSEIAGVLPNTEMYPNVEEGLPAENRQNFKDWIDAQTVYLLRQGVPRFAIKDVARRLGVSEADINRLADLTRLLYPGPFWDVVPNAPSDVLAELAAMDTGQQEMADKLGVSLEDLLDKGRFETSKPVLVEAYHGTSRGGITGNQFSSEFAGANTNVESARRAYFFAGGRLTSEHYAMENGVKEKWANPSQVFKFFVKMRNPLVYDMKGSDYREESFADILKRAKENGHDGAIILNTYDGSTMDNVFAVLHGNEDQIKSADPTTYDDAGKPIAMERRFQAGNRDIRYQKEGEAAPEGETATQAYRNAVQERRQKTVLTAMERLRQKSPQAPTFAPGAPQRGALTVTPVNRRPLLDTMQSIRELRQKIEKSGRSMAGMTDAELERWELLLNRAEQLSSINPITPQMDAEFTRAVRRNPQSSEVIDLLEEAAQKAFGISNFVPGGIHDPRVNRRVGQQLAAKTGKTSYLTVTINDELVVDALSDTPAAERLSFIKDDIAKIVKVALRTSFSVKEINPDTWRQDVVDYIKGKRDRFSERQEDELDDLVKTITNYLRFRQVQPSEDVLAANVFQTGKPVLVSVHRGGELKGDEFREGFLGAFTGALSAKMGYFFAGRKETSRHYSPIINRYILAMYNPLVHDYKGQRYREERLSKVIKDAFAKGHDGVIAINFFDPKPIDNVFIIPPGGENRIKAYEVTYSAEQERIPLSERFNPATKNVLYQEEGGLPLPEGETTAAAFRRKQAEERQKRLQAAMNKLREGAGKATEQAKTEAPKAAPKAEPKGTAPKTPPKPAQPKAPKPSASSQRRRGFGDKTVDEIFERLIERAEEGTLKSVPMSATEALESRIMNGLRKVILAAYVENTLDPSVADEALKAAKDVLDAQASGEQGRMDDAVKAFRDVVSKASKPKTRKSDEERLKEKEARVGQPKKVKSDEELVEAEINRYMGLFAERKDKLDAEIEIDGQKVSRREYLLKAMEDLRQAVKAKDILGQAKARSVMRSLIILPPYPSRPLKFTEMINPAMWGKDAPRSPLSTLNIIGSYEAVAGELGKMVSEVFRVTISLNAQGYYPSTGAAIIDLEKQLEPLLVKLDEQGYKGMRPTIEAHVERIRQSFQGVGKLNKENLQKALENKQVGNIAAAVLKAFVYNTSLRFNPKSVLMNELQPLFTLWPFLTTREFVAIAKEARNPKTVARVRELAIKESGGRYEGIQSSERPAVDPFARSSERARIMGHLAGELIADRLKLTGPNRWRYISEWTAKVEFDNSAWNVPPLFSGPLKSTAFQFKAYTVKNLERFYYDWTRGVEGASSGTAARRAKMIAAQVAVGGVSSLLTLMPSVKGITGVLLLGYLAQGLSKMLGDDEWGNKLAEAIYYGAPAFIGLDLSSSVGFLDEPFGNTIAEQALNFLTGPAVYKSVTAAQEVAKYFAEREKPAPLGRESEKEERLSRQGRKVLRGITPLARMGETAYDLARGKRPELYLDKEMPLTGPEVALRLAGGSPLRQTRFFDEKEAYDWQKKLLNRPVDVPGVERLKGEPESTYQLRVQRRQEYQQRFLPQLQAARAFQRLPKPEQDAVLDALQRNITEQASMKKPDLRKLEAGYLLRARFAGAPERREREKKRLYNEPEEVK